MQSNDLATSVEDHALEAVPAENRKGWLSLSWSTVGIVTTLVQLFIGALTTFVAGLPIALAAGLFVAVVGALLGWGVGHVAYRTGLSSTVLSRQHGFGRKGSILIAAVFGFLIIGFLALENVLLYKGFLFYLNLPDTMMHRVIIYGLLTLAWVLITAFGFNLVSRVSSWTVVAFLGVLAYMMYDVIASSGHSLPEVLSFGSQVPGEALAALGAQSDFGKFAFCVNVMLGSAGALALIDADLGRYARSSRDIGVAAVLGNLFMDVVMLAVGGIVMYAGMDALIDYYVTTGMTREAAQAAAVQSPDSVAGAFIVFGGIIGTLLMVLAQSKAQVLNVYSASLSLSNLFDAGFGWRPGRLAFVVLANVLALLMLAGSILEWFNTFVTVLGVLTTSFAGIIVADYFVVRRLLPDVFGRDAARADFNWAGIVTCVLAFVLAHYVLSGWMPVQFFVSITVSLVVYPVLRLAGARRLCAQARFE
ncbi:cytosine permease [Pigmentiphaga sp. D-2]|uniref:purine-cytosine permease family protein n=1 Tax=Pigmentiphaga sp. D-2 TaxID=1002116 RepID=UPI001045A263|nr:cytosine permease [Pigmentiphaga sp. D-2]